MAKGLGETQGHVLDVLTERAKPMALCSLIWEVAARDVLDEHGNIPAERYGAIHRAVGRLLKRQVPPIRLRRSHYITDFERLERWYPDRTRSARVRDFRRRLLPHLRAFVEKVGVKKQDVDTETFFLGYRFLSESKRAEALRAWQASELLLIRSLPSMAADARRNGIDLLVRAREVLALDASVSARVSLVHTLGAVHATVSQHHPKLARSLKAVRDTLPTGLIKRECFKQRIYMAVALKRGEPPHLLEDFKRFLLDVEPTIVRGLPGHAEPTPSVDARASESPPGSDPDWFDLLTAAPRGRGPWRRPIVFSKELDELIDRHVLMPIDFYELAAEPHA